MASQPNNTGREQTPPAAPPKTNSKGDRKVARYWKGFRRWTRVDRLSPGVRRVLVGMVGGLLLLVGVAMLLLPGPAFIVIPLALAVLATEFMWARRWVKKAKNLLRSARNGVKGS